jgi:hypothetical protein
MHGAGRIVAVVVAAAEVHPPTVTVTLYVPEFATVTFEIEGFWRLELKLFGPLHK